MSQFLLHEFAQRHQQMRVNIGIGNHRYVHGCAAVESNIAYRVQGLRGQGNALQSALQGFSHIGN